MLGHYSISKNSKTSSLSAILHQPRHNHLTVRLIAAELVTSAANGMREVTDDMRLERNEY